MYILITIIPLLIYKLSASANKCNVSIDISNGFKSGSSITKNGLVYHPENYFKVGNQIRGCVCEVSRCLKKCCPFNQSAKLSKDRNVACFADDSPFILSELDVDSFHLIFGHACRCNEEQLNLDPLQSLDYEYKLYKNGTLLWMDLPFNYQNFCVDLRDGREFVVICVENEDEKEKVGEQLHRIGMIISIPFLLATFVAYALLPDRNLHMKALMSYVINLLIGNIFLVIIQMSPTKFDHSACLFLGYFCLFFFMVSFFWMNVICIDIWFAFSGLRGFSGSKRAENKRFYLYCAYAWGMSILHAFVVFLINTYASKKSWFTPGIGESQCFLQRGYSELFYFYGPMGILITINIILFTVTAFKIRKVKQDTSMLKKNDSRRHTYENDKQKFNLYLKLLFAMGVNWSMELISWAVGWKFGEAPLYIWYLTDFCNAIYGVFIFFIFVFKKSIWLMLKKRYYSFIGKPYLAHSMTQNQTRTTNSSTVTTSLHGTTATEMLTTET